MRIAGLVALIAVIAGLLSCSGTQRTVGGAAAGGTVGVLSGAFVGGPVGAVAGGAVGAGVGAYVMSPGEEQLH